MLGRGFQWTAGRVKHPKPAAIFLVPHYIPEIVKTMRGKLAIATETRMGCHPRKQTQHARLILQHFELRPARPPSIVEVAKKTAVFPIDTSGKPGFEGVLEGFLKFAGQSIGSGCAQRFR